MYYFPNERHEYILFLDVEFDKEQLVQFAGILMRRVQDEYYAIYRSLNVYRKIKLNYGFTRYTGIKQNFLNQYGITLEEMAKAISDQLLLDVPPQDLLLVGHNLHSDLHILWLNNISLQYGAEYCTFKQSSIILKRKKNLSLEDICLDAGIYPLAEHNAYADVLLTIHAFSFLKDLED